MNLIQKYIQDAFKKLEKDLDKLSDTYIKQGKEQLIAQGHRASGRLEKSFENEVKGTFKSAVESEIKFNDYGIYLDTGVRPDKVGYSIQMLIPWAKIKFPNKSIDEIKSFLHATRQVHKTEGISTKASSRFSKNGKRTGWISDMTTSVKNPEDLISFNKVLEFLLDSVINKYNG